MIKPNLLPSNSEYNSKYHELNSTDDINIGSGNPNTNESINYSKLNTHQSFNNTLSCTDDVYLSDNPEIQHPYKSKVDDILKTKKIYVSLNNNNNVMNIIDDTPNDLSENSLNQKVGNNDKETSNIINSDSNSDSNIDNTSKNIKKSKNNLKNKINKSKNNNNSNGISKISKTTKYTAKKKKLVHLKQTETSISTKKLSSSTFLDSSKTNISKPSKQQKQQKIKTAINKNEHIKSSRTVAKSEDENNKKSLIGNINNDNNNMNELVSNINDENKDSKTNDFNIVKSIKKSRVSTSKNKINKTPTSSKKELNSKVRTTSVNKNKYKIEINKKNNENKIYDKNSTDKSENNDIKIVEYLYENKINNDKNSTAMTSNKESESDTNYIKINRTNKYLKTNISSSNGKESFESAVSTNSLKGESEKSVISTATTRGESIKSATSTAMTKKNSIKSTISRSVKIKEPGRKILKLNISNTTTPTTITKESHNISSTINEKEFDKTTINSDLSKPTSKENIKSKEQENVQLASTFDINLNNKSKVIVNKSYINSNDKLNITKKGKKEKKFHKSKDDLINLTKLPEIPNLSTKQQSSYINTKSSIKQLFLEQQQINNSKTNSKETDQIDVKSSTKQSIPNHEAKVIYQGINNLYSDSGGKILSKDPTITIKNHPVPIKTAKLPILSDLSTSIAKIPSIPIEKASAITSSVNLNDVFPTPENKKLAPLSSLNDANKRINDLIERENLKFSENLIYMNNQHQSRSTRTVLKPISLTNDLPYNNDNTSNEIGIKKSPIPLSPFNTLNKPLIHPIKPNNQIMPDFGNSTSDPFSNETTKMNHESPFPLLRKTKK